MKISQLQELLQQLASQSEEDGRSEDAKGLRILAEAFDGPRNQKVVKMLDNIRRVRRLGARL